MGATSPVHERLRLGTDDVHRRLERRLNLEVRFSSAPLYRELLAAMRGFYAPVERALLKRAADYDGYEPRAQTPRLDEDLAALGFNEAEIASLPECALIPSLDGHGQAAGCLYVLEGATLGGQVMSQMVLRQLGPDTSVAFFSGDGAGTRKRWLSFLNWLSGIQAPTQTVADAARETFLRLEHWLEDCGVLTP